MTQKKAFRIEGTFPMGVNRKQPFAREVISADDKEAKELVYSLIGSEHAIARRMIKVTSVKELKPNEITSLKVKRTLGVK